MSATTLAVPSRINRTYSIQPVSSNSYSQCLADSEGGNDTKRCNLCRLSLITCTFILNITTAMNAHMNIGNVQELQNATVIHINIFIT
jgi:hypothetical protein